MLHINLFISTLVLLCKIVDVSSRGPVYKPPDVERLTTRFNRSTVTESYDYAFGASNIHVTNNGTNADISLDKSSVSSRSRENWSRRRLEVVQLIQFRSGVVSRYYYGFFNAALKLPAGFTSGVVVAFYLSNANVFPRNHDELDIELLGHEKRRDWVLQTNIYGNGSVSTGREEKFYLWFDPTLDFHNYSILWNNRHILFLVDDVPVRRVERTASIGAVYPSKAMSVYATIWDGSEWATHGGKYPVDYRYAPFVVAMRGVETEGCVFSDRRSNNCSSFDRIGGGELTKKQSSAMEWVRRKHMFYSYCKDFNRYKVMPQECNAN